MATLFLLFEMIDVPADDDVSKGSYSECHRSV